MIRFIIISCFAWAFFASPGCAQNISEYRYWWDDDVSSMVTSTVTAGQVLNLQTDLSTAALGNGHHHLTFQAKDDSGAWSVPYTAVIFQNGNLANYQYWFDDDISSSTVLSTPETDLQEINTSIDVSGLSPGIHKITMRSLANNGESSVPYTRYFKNSGGDLVGWEYWFDDDVSTTIQESVSPPQSMLDLMDNLNSGSLSEGSHTVTWRCRDANANWSVPITYAFELSLGLNEISGLNSVLIYPSPARDQLSIKIATHAQLQLDVDVLNQQGKTISSYKNALSSNKSQLTIDVSNLAAGIYFVRLRDAEKNAMYKFVKL